MAQLHVANRQLKNYFLDNHTDKHSNAMYPETIEFGDGEFGDNEFINIKICHIIVI